MEMLTQSKMRNYSHLNKKQKKALKKFIKNYLRVNKAKPGVATDVRIVSELNQSGILGVQVTKANVFSARRKCGLTAWVVGKSQRAMDLRTKARIAGLKDAIKQENKGIPLTQCGPTQVPSQKKYNTVVLYGQIKLVYPEDTRIVFDYQRSLVSII